MNLDPGSIKIFHIHVVVNARRPLETAALLFGLGAGFVAFTKKI
jgi:hypothetical protein